MTFRLFQLIRRALGPKQAHAVVDEDWYLSQYSDVREAVAAGQISSASEHYHLHGRREKRLPAKPQVDEVWYLLRYPDIARAIESGREKSAYDHFVTFGHREGRLPQHPSRSNRQP